MSNLFIHNKYREIYIRLVQRAKSENRSKGEVYYEGHHIVPRSLGGFDRGSNIVLLTGKEHYLAHRLLVKFTNEEYRSKMVFAMHRMIHGEKEDRYYPCSRVYETIRQEHARYMSEMNTGVKQSPETCLKKSIAHTGKIVSESTRKKIGDIHRGKKVSQETIEKRRATMEAKGGYHKHDEETREKIGAASRGRKFSEEHKRKISEAQKRRTDDRVAWNKGKPHSEKHKEALRAAWARRKASGINN